ncbi:sterol carrier family protein [Luteococcus sp.]|uniref:sterol carrier family protein n=1 Tax=Luteococcus sp. TaxID=1969402 RepID=UPI003735818D
MSIMASRIDRALRTTSELLVAQCRVLATSSSLPATGHSRLVVLVDGLLEALDKPSNARNQSWSALLAKREVTATARQELATELRTTTQPEVLQRLAASRTATLESALAGTVPMSVHTDDGISHLNDLLRAVLVELVVLADMHGPGLVQPAALRACVRALSQALGERFAGQTIEVRIPPASAVQVGAFGEGPTHTRGTPPNVVETDEITWLRLATGLTSLPAALNRARANASGSHHQALQRMLPVVDLSRLA